MRKRLAVLFRVAPFRLFGMEVPNHTQLPQRVGMIFGVYCVAYTTAAHDTLRRWPVVMAGLLGKSLGPIRFVGALVRVIFPTSFGATIILNDLIWWVPSSLILLWAYKTRHKRKGAAT